MHLYNITYSLTIERLRTIINTSMEQYAFPHDWKISYVTAAPKTTNPVHHNDLWLIPVTPLIFCVKAPLSE